MFIDGQNAEEGAFEDEAAESVQLQHREVSSSSSTGSTVRGNVHLDQISKF